MLGRARLEKKTESGKTPNVPKDSFLINWGIYGAVGFQLAMSVVVGIYVGGWADTHWGKTPLFTILGLLVGSIAGFYNLIRILTWHQERKRS